MIRVVASPFDTLRHGENHFRAAGGLLMRDREKIDSELRLVAALLRSARHHGQPTPANQRMNDLLDERLRIEPRDGQP